MNQKNHNITDKTLPKTRITTFMIFFRTESVYQLTPS